MTRVLVVQRDPVVAEQMAASLRAAGYETELCGGPQREPCPVIADMPCPLVDRADVLVYDAWVAGNAFGGHELVTASGDLCQFRNDIPHWVENDSDDDRWSLIICIRNRWTP